MSQPYSDYDERDDRFRLEGEARAEELLPRDRRLTMLFLTLVVMALFAGGLYFAYVYGTRHAAGTARGAGSAGGLPLIRADNQPTKIRPDRPGGMKIPDQNVLLYNEKQGGPPVENLLPPPEQPMPRPAPPPPPPPPAPVVEALAPTAPAPAAAAAPAAPTQAAAAPATAAVAPAPVAALPAMPKPDAKNMPEPAGRVAAAAPRPERSGPVRLRLGSVRSPEKAREEWARLKRDHPDLLGRLTAVAVRADLGDKGIFYRIEAGSFGDPAAAEKLCGELKRRNLGCILAR